MFKNGLFALIKQRNFLFSILFFLWVFFPFLVTLAIILTGNIPFWSDPARDLLQASLNFHKFSLLGPPSGIPGVFYGPYWIWLLQGALLISKDPRSVTIIISLLPYFFLFPLLLLLYVKFFGKKVVLLLWILFLFGNVGLYASDLWNPRPAPLLFLFLTYLFATNTYITWSKKSLMRLFFTGFLAGFIANFHLSFGLGVLAGSYLFLLLLPTLLFLNKTAPFLTMLKHGLKNLLLFTVGLQIAYIPFVLFELKHQFLQIHALTHTVLQSVLYNSAVVGQTGFSKQLILTFFALMPASFFHVPDLLGYAILILLIFSLLLYLFKQKGIPLSVKNTTVQEENQLILFLLSVTVGLIVLYLLTKNPVWNYHFIGVDVLALLFIGYVVSRTKLLTWVLAGGVLILVLFSIPTTLKTITSIKQHDYTVASLATKEHTADIIRGDSATTSYVVFAYSPAIYDYEYLFQWKNNHQVFYQPITMQPFVKSAYIILPKGKYANLQDFINYVTPTNQFHTEKTIPVGVDITIVKRVRN